MIPGPILSIKVPVRAVPGANSKRGFVNPRTGRVILVDKTKGKDQFVATVRQFAAVAADEANWKMIDGPVMLSISFIFARPAGHYGTGKNAGKVKPRLVGARPTGKPDLTNVIKRTEDALKGIAWHDDSQVVYLSASKYWGETDLIEITVLGIENGPNFAQDESGSKEGRIYRPDQRKPARRKARAVSDEGGPVPLPGQGSFLEEAK